jgi:hypothetical protein
MAQLSWERSPRAVVGEQVAGETVGLLRVMRLRRSLRDGESLALGAGLFDPIVVLETGGWD